MNASNRRVQSVRTSVRSAWMRVALLLGAAMAMGCSGGGSPLTGDGSVPGTGAPPVAPTFFTTVATPQQNDDIVGEWVGRVGQAPDYGQGTIAFYIDPNHNMVAGQITLPDGKMISWDENNPWPSGVLGVQQNSFRTTDTTGTGGVETFQGVLNRNDPVLRKDAFCGTYGCTRYPVLGCQGVRFYAVWRGPGRSAMRREAMTGKLFQGPDGDQGYDLKVEVFSDDRTVITGVAPDGRAFMVVGKQVQLGRTRHTRELLSRPPAAR